MNRQTIFKGSPIAVLAFSVLLLVGSSCTKQESAPQPEKVVARADFSMEVGENDGGTKASVSDGFLNWQTGDLIVMASNGQINGTLVCTSVDGDGSATFSGEITNFTPAGVNLYFLGNRNVDGMTPQFDFSLQQGNIANAANYVFLKKTGVILKEVTDHSWEPEGSVVFEGMTSLLTLNLAPANSPAAKGGIATSAKIDGLKNCMTVDLATGDVTSSYVKMLGGTDDNTVTTVSPRYVGELSNSYVVAVIPQNASGLAMNVNYLNTDGSTETTRWSGINWDMTDKAGKTISTDWTSAGKTPTIVESSLKGGYSGVAVEGGENADGLNHKGGYDGVNVGDEADNPQGNKGGYTGTEVL